MYEIPTVDSLMKWRSQVTEEIERIKVELSNLQIRLTESNERLELIDKLLALGNKEKKETIKLPTNTDNLIDECVVILREVGKPMHIRELHLGLLNNGIPIPGKGNQANVIARLQRSEGRIIRTGRGMYSLPEFGLPEKKPVRK